MKIPALLIGIIMLLPFGAHAQTQEDLNQQLIALLWEQVYALQEQLADLLAAQILERDEARAERKEQREFRERITTNEKTVTTEVKKHKIELSVSETEVKVGEGTIEFRVTTYSPEGKKRLPVVVETDSPDMPSKFTINSDEYPPSWFIVTKDSQGVVTGSPTPYPFTAGEFTFTFTIEGTDVSESVKVTVTE